MIQTENQKNKNDPREVLKKETGDLSCLPSYLYCWYWELCM